MQVTTFLAKSCVLSLGHPALATFLPNLVLKSRNIGFGGCSPRKVVMNFSISSSTNLLSDLYVRTPHVSLVLSRDLWLQPSLLLRNSSLASQLTRVGVYLRPAKNYLPLLIGN